MMLLAVLLAAASPSADAGQQAPEAAKEERKICKRIDSTQSRLGAKRVCKTAAEWANDSDRAGRDAGRSKSEAR